MIAQPIECLNDLDNLLASLPNRPIYGECIAYWSDDHARIIFDGVFTGKSNGYLPPAQGFRWHSPEHGNKGMFGRGLALYGRKLPDWSKDCQPAK